MRSKKTYATYGQVVRHYKDIRLLAMINKTLKLVTTEDHQQIAVWEITANEPQQTSNDSKHKAKHKQNLLFIHGAFSDKTVCLGIASYSKIT